LLGVTPQRFRQLAIEPFDRVARSPWYDLQSVIELAAKRLSAPQGSGDNSGAELTQERTALIRSRRKFADLDLAARQGELLEATAVEERWTRMTTNARAKILSLVRRLPPAIRSTDFSHRVIASVVKDHVYEILHELTLYDGTRPLPKSRQNSDGNGTKG
jgi:hypothetical protein